MKKEIAIPKGVDVNAEGMKVTVKGPKGMLERDFHNPTMRGINIEIGEWFSVSSEDESRRRKAIVGTIAAHVRNMIIGVTKGYEYTLGIHYSHFPINVEVKGDEIHVKNFFGEKGARIARTFGKVEVKATKDVITVKGINSEDVGQTALNIEQICRISGKDRRIFNDGIYITSKGAGA